MILSRREGRSVTVHLVLTTKYRRKAFCFGMRSHQTMKPSMPKE
ncbi:hypothetical protein [Cylindrospermopsis raciborskii]|nr:hypothetical protein [Cylindrospermopsis raciborskii]